MGNQIDRTTFDSWKEIAAYLRRTEKTCRRWEKVLGLPVHRLEDSPRARVFAYEDEIDLWVARAGHLGALKDNGKAREARSKAGKKRFVFAVAAFTVILVCLGVSLGIFKKERPLRSSTPIQSIAILPFEDLSPRKDLEYLADGMTDALINALCGVPGLRVQSRTSSFFFKGKKTPLSEIGSLLRADALIEGSIQASGEKIRLTVQLVKTADGYQLWSQKYDRNQDDIFAVQDDIARSVVAAVRLGILEK